MMEPSGHQQEEAQPVGLSCGGGGGLHARSGRVGSVSFSKGLVVGFVVVVDVAFGYVWQVGVLTVL